MSSIRPPFRATYKGRSVWGFDLTSGIRHGDVLMWVKVAHWDRRSWESFCALDGEQQSFLVAAYVTEMQCQAVEASEAVKERRRT